MTHALKQGHRCECCQGDREVGGALTDRQRLIVPPHDVHRDAPVGWIDGVPVPRPVGRPDVKLDVPPDERAIGQSRDRIAEIRPGAVPGAARIDDLHPASTRRHERTICPRTGEPDAAEKLFVHRRRSTGSQPKSWARGSVGQYSRLTQRR